MSALAWSLDQNTQDSGRTHHILVVVPISRFSGGLQIFFAKAGKTQGGSDFTIRWHQPGDAGLLGPEEPHGAGGTGDVQERVIALYETHREAIYRFLVRQGLSPEVAQEVTQDVFVDLFVALERGTQMKSEQGWLYAVAGRAAIDHWRRERSGTLMELDAGSNLAENLPSRDASPEAEAEHKQRLGRVAAALQKLPKEHQLCIHLRMQGLRYREIANILRVSTSTVAEWLVSAVDHLRGEA